ncbi:AEC family transporter [Azospirillum sp. B506]|uniref:AEC family transporter n=1 Tax=Azospirillum sp. B506 TaxID=137721 RepID=UPI00034B8A7F|nr:AEC family transporter [Azospirillum sp. B506]
MPNTLMIVGPIFILISVGYVAVRAGVMSKSDTRTLGKLVISFALPALLFRSLSQRSFSEILNTSYLVAYAAGSLAVMAIGVSIAYFRQKKTLQASALYGMGMSCSNSGFVGYPMLLQLLGPPAAVALALNMLVENILLLPLAIALAESGRRSGTNPFKVFLRSCGGLLKNPLILAIIAGMVFSIFGIAPPEPVSRAVDMLATASGAVALFAVGGTLVGLEVRGMAGDIAQVTIGKLLLHPLMVFATLLMLPPIDPKLQVALIASACVPMLSIYPIFGQRYGQEGICAATLLVATLAFFLSISVVLWMMERSALFGTFAQ